MAAPGYNPYTGLIGLSPGQQLGYRGIKPPPKPKVFGPTPTTGYAPGGVTWKPIPPGQRVGPGGAPIGGALGPAKPGGGTTVQPEPGGQTAGGGGAPPYFSDPVYQQIVAMANRDVADAQAAATAARKQLVIELGDPSLAGSLGLGSLVAAQAQANPFSTLKNLLRGHNQNVQNIDQSANVANLWSSSTRGRQQLLEGTGYQGNIAGAESSAQQGLAQILNNLLAAQAAARDRIAAGAGDAYGRWITAGNTDPGAPPPVAAKPPAKKKPPRKPPKKPVSKRGPGVGFGNYGYPTGGPLVVTTHPWR